MDSIPVVWHEGSNSLDHRSRYGIATLLNETFDFTREYEFVHFSTMAGIPATATEAVVVLHGEHELGQVDQILSDLSKFKRSIVVVIGDDAAQFPSARLVHPSRRLWIQMPVPGRHNFASRKLICGYPDDCKMHLAPFDARSVDRPLDWFFSGQITHQRRRLCIAELQRIPNGHLVQTPGFWQGLERSEYYRQMSRAKVIPCPSGPVTPDTIRVAESLESGCIPLADATCPRPGYPHGYWNYVLGETPPFPVIEDWRELPHVMKQVLSEWPDNRDCLLEWWVKYKKSMCDWMKTDLEELRRDRQ